MIDVNLEDDVLAWVLGPDGEWRKVPTAADPAAARDTHTRFQALATERSRSGSR